MATLAIKIDPGQASHGARTIRKEIDWVADAAQSMEKAVDKAAASAGKIGGGSALGGARNVKRSIDEIAKASDGAGRNVVRFTGAANDNFAKLNAQVAGVTSTFRTLAAVLGPLAGLLSIRALTQYADAWSDMQSQVGAAIRDMEAAPRMMQRLVDIANASYSPLSQTVEVYSRNVAVLRDLGVGAKGAADFTEALNHALVLTATRGERAASVQNALSKAMAVGKLQAEGLETILAHGGEVAQVLADGLGTTVAGLRKMASDGKITGDVIANSLIKRLDDLRERAGEMPATIGDAFVRIGTNLTALIGQMDKATGVSEAIANALITFANNLERIATYASTAAVAFGTYYVAALVAANASTITLTGSLALLRAALIRLGIGALLVGAGELVYQFTQLAEATGGFGQALEHLGERSAILFDAVVWAFRAAGETIKAIWYGVMADILRATEDAFGGILRAFGISTDSMAASIKRMEQSAANWGDIAASSAVIAGEQFKAAFAGLEPLNEELNETSEAGVAAAGGLDAATEAAQRAEEQFLRTADALAEKMFPGHAAAAEAAELLHLLDQFGDKLTDIQRIAVEARIDELFTASALGLRDLSSTSKKAAKEMREEFEPVRDLFHGLLDILYESGDAMDKLISLFAGIGKQFAQKGLDRILDAIGLGKSGGSSGGSLASISSLANAGFGGGRAGLSPVQTAQIGREIGAAAAPSMSASIDTGMESFMAAIRKVESGSYGGDYGALGPIITKGSYKGDRAYGAYQVMGGNIEQWTREVLGTSMSIKDFLSNQAAQDKVAYAKLGQSIDKFGTFSDAASVWFSGGPLSKNANRSDGYNSVQQYVGKVNSAMEAYPGGTRAAIRDGTVDAAKRIQTFGGQPESFDTGTGAPGVFGQGMKDVFGVGAAAFGAFAGGYQSGSPVMGALSGAMTGFGAAPMLANLGFGAAAGPIGIIGGALIGLIGGLLGRAKQKREELKKAQQELESQIGAITQLIASATGNFMGEFEKSITSTSDEFAKAIALAQKAKNTKLVNELKAAQDEFFKETTERWVRGFDGMLASMQAGLGFDGAFSSGMDAVEKMRESLVGFVNDAKMFAEANGDLAGYMAARNKAYGIGVSNAPLNEYSATRSAHGGEVNLDNEFIEGYVELGKQAVKSGIEAFNRDGGQFYDTIAELRQAIDQAGYELDELGLLVKKAVDPVGDLAESVERARLAAIDTALAMLSGAREFTEMEEAVQKLEGAAAGLPTLLGDLGMAAEEAATAIEKHLMIAMQKMRLSVETDLVRSIADLSDLGYLNDLFDTLANMQTRIRDAYASGADARLVFTELSLRLRQIAGDAELSAETLTKLADVFPEFTGQLMELAGMGTGSSLSSAKAALDQAKADLRAAYEDEKSTIEQLISRHQSLIKSLRQFLDDLRLDSNLSPLDPFQRLQEAQKQFQETAQLALTGDEEALGKLESVSRSYLEEARAYYATSEAYFSIFTEVESILDQALSVADKQLSEAEQQLAALDAQIGQLIDIADNTKSIADAIADLAVAEAAYAAAVDARFAEMAALMQMQREQQKQQADYYVSPEVMKLYQDIQGRFPEREGAEYWQKIFGSGLDINEIYRRFIHDSLYLGYTPNPNAVAQYGVGNVGSSGLPMFSGGGFTGLLPTSAVAGVVHGQEFVMNAEATRRWRPQFEAMNAGRWPSGGGQDNSALVAEIRALRQQVADLERSNAQVTVAAAREQVAATEGTTQAVNRQADGAWRKSKARMVG